jgi:hypothetical protein
MGRTKQSQRSGAGAEVRWTILPHRLSHQAGKRIGKTLTVANRRSA